MQTFAVYRMELQPHVGQSPHEIVDEVCTHVSTFVVKFYRALDKEVLPLHYDGRPDELYGGRLHANRQAAGHHVLSHALGNLLDNALTYTDRGGRITLSATLADSHVMLAVADTGIGIPPEYLSHIFDRFSRFQNQSRGAGTGLGLAIVREIVTAHGGDVKCESQPGKGTTFRIRLPRYQESGVRGQESGITILAR